jgi:hypothetical protein
LNGANILVREAIFVPDFKPDIIVSAGHLELALEVPGGSLTSLLDGVGFEMLL